MSTHHPTPAEAARFLLQATLGPTPDEIARVVEIGYEAWIDEQFELPPSIAHHEVHVARLAGLHFEVHHAWWRQVLNAPDALRHRLAVALSEIFVISEVAIEFVAWEFTEYYDDLGRMAFGNWRDLLRAVTLDPLMGYYLTYLRNRKADPAQQRFPDENYAREVMQLFSIGLWELNPDGTHKLDAQGREIPTYDNREIMEFARVFTGLSFGGPTADPKKPEDFFNAPLNYSVAMEMWEDQHDRGEKVLLRGKRLPAFDQAPGRKGMDDIDDAVTNLFEHPNVGPFFGRLLIQRLVSSNPTPAYIARVAAAFADNGRGVRGDMRAVIKAILLDPEARTVAPIGPLSGRLREPYLRYVALARSFRARSEAGTYKSHDHEVLLAMNQIVMNSPSVFNFFLPDYQQPGKIAEAGLYAPEFQIMTSTTAITSANVLTGTVATGFGDFSDGPDRLRLDLSEETKLADRPDELIELLDAKLTGGLLGAETKRILRTAWAEMPAEYTAEQRVQALMQLIVLAPDCAVTQ
ncbi:MAG: DUF1800 domain-containing protein [Verrucomicrobia bacterium]|nr:DUF1800 domain-containing protein [Verrucomicrobiota bacterium]